MASVMYKLAGREVNGKHQVILWLKVSGYQQYRIKSNVFVSTDIFEVTGGTGGNQYGHIKVPKRSKLNFNQVDEAVEAKRLLDELTAKMMRFCVTIPKSEQSKETFLLAAEGVMSAGIDATWEALQNYRNVKDRPSFGFFESFDQYLRENDIAERLEKNLRVIMRTLHRWQCFKHRTIDLDTFSSDDLLNIREYMAGEYKLQEEFPEVFATLIEQYPAEIRPNHCSQKIQPRGNNTLVIAMKRLRAYWNWLCGVKHYTDNDPFKDFKIGQEKYGVPYYLTIAERNIIASHDFGANRILETRRDIFIFHCFIGCRVGDLMKLTADNIHDGVLEYVPHKTKDGSKVVKARIPLSDKAKELIKKYDGVDKKGRLFPFGTEQRYNDCIKSVLKACGIDRAVPVRNPVTEETEMKPIYEVASSHMARRTFVGNAYAKVKDPNLIAKMSGHVEGSTAFARYRNIEDEALREIIDLIK